MKKPFLTLAQAQKIKKTYPTPFHIYDERGIRENARALKAAFAYNPNLFPIGDGFGLLVFFDRYESTYFRNGVQRKPTSKPRGPRKKKLAT